MMTYAGGFVIATQCTATIRYVCLFVYLLINNLLIHWENIGFAFGIIACANAVNLLYVGFALEKRLQCRNQAVSISKKEYVPFLVSLIISFFIYTQ